jgi:imidazolonepropionase-like amidohydrolase
MRAVREKIGSGADWIHLRATGAAAGLWGADTELLTEEEMTAAARTAHGLGKRVTCNACGTNGMKNAIRAGVDCIEHGTHIGEDDDVIPMMVDRGVGWVPTLYVSLAKQEEAQAAEARGERSSIPEYWLKRELALIEIWRRGFEKAMAAGVMTAIGTDMGAPFLPHGKNAKELEVFVNYGASEMQAIEAATSVAARVLGLEEELGTVEAGKVADVIVVKKDPLEDIKILQESENINLVIKNGQIVVDRRRRAHLP